MVWIKQDRGEFQAYALILRYQQNGAKRVISCDNDTFKPVVGSTRFWHPDPVYIEASEVPEKILNKIEKHVKKLEIKTQ